MTNWWSRIAQRKTLAAVLAAGFALRLFFLLLPVSRDDDTAVYTELARNWFQRGVYGVTTAQGLRPTLIRLPGYPMFLGAVFAVFGQHRLWPGMVIQAVLDLAGCWLLYDVARTEVSRRAGWAALLLAALCPFTAAYTAAGMTESLSISCVSLAVWSLARTVRAAEAGNDPRWPLIALGGAMGYAILLRPDAVLLAAAFCASLFWYARKSLGNGRALRLAATAAALAALPLVPWTVRNLRTFHTFQPLAPRYANNPGEFVPLGFIRWMRTWSVDFVDAGTVFWNLDGQIDMDDIPPRACYTPAECRLTETLIGEHDQTDTVTPELDAKFGALAGQRIREQPWNYYVRFPLERVFAMWFWPRTELFNIEVHWWRVADHAAESAWAMALALVNLGYVGLAVVGFARRRVPFSAALLGYVALRCILLATVESPEQRYTMVMFPVLFLAGACALGKGDVAAERKERRAEPEASPLALQ